MKTNGATWNAYLDSWPEGQWLDDSDEKFDGKTPLEACVHPESLVEFSVGDIYDSEFPANRIAGLVDHFKAWQFSQTHTKVVVKVPNEMLVEFNKAVKLLGDEIEVES